VVAAAEHLPDAPGNTFVADLNVDKPDGSPFVTAIQLKWQGKRNLVVRYDHSTHVYTKNLRVGDVTVGYKIE
jgi:zona occludens toxin (predicted ATPase)